MKRIPGSEHNAAPRQARKEDDTVAKTFRYKRSIPVGYDDQGHIWFLSRRYKKLEAAEQKQIRELCRKAAGAHASAVLEYVTTDRSSVAVCDRHNLSESTLERMVKRYYIAFAGRL